MTAQLLIEEYQKETGQKARLKKQVPTTDNGILDVEYYTDGFIEWLINEIIVREKAIEALQVIITKLREK